MSEQTSLPLEVSVSLPEVARDYGLPPWDADAHCPKCQGESVTVRYHDTIKTAGACFQTFWDEFAARGHTYFPEHLDRSCSRCKYGWVEAVSDRAV